MKKAVVNTGSKQYLVAEGDTIEVELLNSQDKKVVLVPLLVTDGDKTTVGIPEVPGSKVLAEIVASDVQTDKVKSIRYKAKKRVHTIRGHRQHKTHLKITKIT